MYGLRIVIADGDKNSRKNLKEKLAQIGYTVVAEVDEGQKALQQIFNIQPDLTIIDYNLPGKGGLEVAKVIEEQGIAPTLLLSDFSDKRIVLEPDNLILITGYLVKPIEEGNLVPAVELAVSNFKKNLSLLDENRKLNKEIENGKYVDKAKRVLMKNKNWTEEEAHKYLQKISMDNSVSIVTVAKRVVKKMYTI